MGEGQQVGARSQGRAIVRRGKRGDAVNPVLTALEQWRSVGFRRRGDFRRVALLQQPGQHPNGLATLTVADQVNFARPARGSVVPQSG